MMNGSYIDGATNPETSQALARDRQGAVPGHAGSDRDALPGDPDPPAQAGRAGAPGSIRRSAKDRRRERQSIRGYLLGDPERTGVSPEPLTRPVRAPASERIVPLDSTRAEAQRECRHEPPEPPVSGTDPTAGDAACRRRRDRRLGFRLDRGPGGRNGHEPQPPQVVHSALDVRRPEPDRYVRPQARPRQQRTVQTDPDGGAGDAPGAALAASSPSRPRISPSSAR